ncbi:MAG: hypothetical protein M3P08_15110 [Thermoproteota archaeon]|nr:hypothetical protein [Thermoproteota archaeon]
MSEFKSSNTNTKKDCVSKSDKANTKSSANSQNLVQKPIPWTTAKIIDQFVTELALAHRYIRNEDYGFVLIFPAYYFQAQELMYRIPVYRPEPPMFEIDVKDLSCQLQCELADLKKLDRRMFDYVVKIAVMHIFENIRFDYTHQSVMPNLRIRFVDR